MHETHYRKCGAERSMEYHRALNQYRAEAYHVLQAVTTHAGNKADTKELGPSAALCAGVYLSTCFHAQNCSQTRHKHDDVLADSRYK